MDTIEAMACRSCGELVYMLVYPPTGKTAPIEAATDPSGNIQVDLEAGTYEIVPRGQPSLFGGQDVALHLNHFVSCPSRKAWRKK